LAKEGAEALARSFVQLFLVFSNESMKQRKFSGVFYYNQSIETIMQVIETSANMTFKYEEGMVYVND
jgi:hypothetical protein